MVVSCQFVILWLCLCRQLLDLFLQWGHEFRIHRHALGIRGKFDHRPVSEDLLPHLDVSSGHDPPALPWELLDHDGTAVPVVSLPVVPLTLLAAVSDSMAINAREKPLLPSHCQLTIEAGPVIFHCLNVELGHLWFLRNYVVLIISRFYLCNLNLKWHSCMTTFSKHDIWMLFL